MIRAAMLVIGQAPPALWRGLRARSGDLALLWQSKSVQDAITLSRGLDILIIDARDAEEDAVPAVQALHTADPRLRILVMGHSEAPELARAVVRSGASGYLLTDTDTADLLLAIHTVCNGQIVFSPAILRGLLANPSQGYLST